MPKKQAYSHLPVKKTGGVNQKLRYEDKFISVTSTPLVAVQYEKICKRLSNLSKVLVRHSFVWNRMVPSELNILKNYLQFYYEYYEFDQYDSTFEILPSLDVNLYTVSNEELIYKSFNLFHNSIWPIRFHNKFVAKVTTFTANQIKYVLSFIMMLSQGHFYGKGALKQSEKIRDAIKLRSDPNSADLEGYGYVVPINTKCIPHNRFFYMKLFRQKNLLFSVGVQKMPIVKSGVIKRYQFHNYIQILDVLSDQVAQNPQKLQETVQRFLQYIREDVAKRDHTDQLVLEPVQKNKKKAVVDHMFAQYLNPYINQNQVFATQFDNQKKYDYRPLVFKPHYVSMSDTSTLIFDRNLKRWVSNDYLTKLEQKALNQYQRKVNEELIKRFVDFQSAKTLVQLLTKIPNFRVELTQQQKDVIGQNGNVLVIGRSGTGKTTCAVLRLFAIQMLFKIRLSLSKKKHQQELKDTRCSADDIDKTMGLHCVFLTASPVLTNQIQRYYKKLTDNIKVELQKKKKRVQQQKRRQEQQEQSMKKKKEVGQEQAQTIQQLKEQQIVEKGGDQSLEVPQKLVIKKSQQVIEQQEQMNKQLGGIQLNQKIEHEGFEQDQQNYDEMKDQLQQKMKKFKSLFDLRQQDYPGFFTVKSFIMMMDGTLPKPFFIRKNEESNQQQSQATWHNEKKGVMMIENYYRNEADEKQEEKVEDQIQQEINYSDQQQLQHEYLRQIQLRENKQKQKLTDKLKKNKKTLSFEVDYDYFLTYFWPNVRHKHYSARNITAHLVWTEIYSTIKGGASAHLYPGFYMTEKAYIIESTNSFLTKQEKLDVYETFCQYERWKINSGGYDMMDAVNYILNFIRFRGYSGPEIHYVMIDQVQDLPHSIVYLLSKSVRYGVFYSGDTAQTIAKGVGFRFCDLKNLFDSKQFDYSLQLNKPVVKQLTVNFRSHNSILQLANSVVSSIQILFPKTIDRLKKQVSNLTGPKPIILSEGDQQLLFYVLCGDQSYKKTGNAEQGLKKPPLEFGCDQVIIVRDQESKNKIPTMLQHALCLTIYQAKGLQFNDVILFNFFTQTKCVQKWNLIKFLKVVINEIDAQQYEKSITKHIKQKEKSEKQKQQMKQQGKQIKEVQPQQIDVQCIVQNKDNKVNIKKIVSDAKIVMKDINDYAQLCSQLKMLYTAITRPKNTLIIYDEDSTARKTIQKLWERLEVIEVVSKQLLEQSNKKNKPESQQIRIFKSIVNSTNKAEWKKQGMKMYARGYFEQAMKCFERSGNQQLYKKSRANNMADTATKKLIQIESQRNAIKNKLIQYQKMSESDLSKLKKKLKKDESVTFIQFEQAGRFFEELHMFKQAGQCYFSGRQYQKSFENFSKAGMNKQAAQSLEMLNKFREASQYYEKQGSYLKVIQCLDMINEWQLILKVIQRFSNQMTDLQKKSLFKKYSALALQQLVYQIQFENQPQQNKPEKNRVQIIKQEQDSQQQDWDSDEDPELAAEKSMSRKSSVDSAFASRKLSNLDGEHETKRKQSLIEDQKVIQQSVYENVADDKTVSKQVMEERENKDNVMESVREKPQQKVAQNNKADQSSFADLNSSSEQQKSIEQPKNVVNIMESIYQKKEQKMEERNQSSKKQQQNPNDVSGSFAELNSEQSSFADLNSEQEYNAKYPSQLGPDMESIKSLADLSDPWIQSALSQIQAKTNTQYSIVDEQQNYNPNVRIIKTKGNIVVQDQIMRKIVGIVSIVNQSVDEFFKQFKGYQSLITVDKTTENVDTIDNRPQISQFEDVDPKFINIILDTLESFKLYKLCLFVCNRYHLPHKAGRYLVSMALKYATNSQINNTLNPALIAPSLSRKSELQKGILASIALHAMFQNVSSDFLKVKVHQYDKQQSKNSLGSYFIQGLILQGLYKKAVFMVNPQQSLKILRNFCDNQVYQQVYKQKFLKKTLQQPAQFLSYPPKSKLQQQYTIVKLQQLLYRHNIIHRLQTISLRFYKQYNLSQIKNNHDPSKMQAYTPLLTALIGDDKAKITEAVNANIGKAQQFMENGPDYKIYDVVAFLATAVNSQHTYKPIFDVGHSEFLELFACLRTIRKTLRHKHKPKSYEIIQSVLSVYNARMIDPCKSSKFINDGYSFVHRTSIICNQFVEELKKNKNQTAFFFEQDYNYVLVRTTKLIQIVAKRFDLAYSKFVRTRIDAKLQWVQQLNKKYLYKDFEDQQSDFLIKALFREEYRQMHPKDKKAKKQSSTVVKKPSRPNFNFKAQGRPELVIDLQQSLTENQSHDDRKQNKTDNANFFIFPDLNPKFKYFADLCLGAFTEKNSHNTRGKMISGRLLYCCGLNDSYKEYISQKEGNNLYDAIEFRKFNRLDMYTDNILSIISQLSYTQRHLFSAQLLIHLMIQYKCLVNGKNFKLDFPRKFLKFLPNLKLIEVVGVQGQVDKQNTNLYLSEGKNICAFSYNNLFSSDYQKNDLSQVICELLEGLKDQQSYKVYNIQKLILLLLVNMPNDKDIYNCLRQFIQSVGYKWQNPILMKIRGASNYQQFVTIRQKILDDKQFMKNCQVLHQVRVTNVSNIDKDITESQNDYQIKQKIQQARAKAVKKIITWWRIVRKKGRPSDQIDILKQNRIVKMTHNVKYLPSDDRFLLRSSNIRDVLLSFYLRNIVTSSLDYHFILMTLNKIEDLRKSYIKAYSTKTQGIMELDQKQIEYEEQIANIQSTIEIWKNDSKWIKDRNIDLKRKKVFEVKWMTKNNIHKIVKKRAGIQKQKKLQIKKQLLKRRE